VFCQKPRSAEWCGNGCSVDFR